MTQRETSQPTAKPTSTLRAVLGDRHFLIAAVVLAVAAAGWGSTIKLLKWVTFKEPVPWPPGVRVDRETRRLLSLPARLGPLVLRADGGDLTLDETRLELLGMKTGYDDSHRFEKRESNWYVTRIYDDARSGRAVGTWQLGVYYYTGGADKVPHVPERCLVANGATWLGSSDMPVTVAGAPATWAGEFKVRRALFAKSGRRFVQYYFFSLNGRPESSWEKVRTTLSLSPWLRHCYFAKIQFAPRGHTGDLNQADRAAVEFLGHVLPDVLKQLPMPQDIERLEGRR